MQRAANPSSHKGALHPKENTCLNKARGTASRGRKSRRTIMSTEGAKGRFLMVENSLQDVFPMSVGEGITDGFI